MQQEDVEDKKDPHFNPLTMTLPISEQSSFIKDKLPSVVLRILDK